VAAGSTKPAAIPSASTAIIREASVSGRRNVLVQVCPCHNEITAMPVEACVETLIRRCGVLGSLNQTRRSAGIRPATAMAKMIALCCDLGQRFSTGVVIRGRRAAPLFTGLMPCQSPDGHDLGGCL
jgi:hypothetical protein